jgi:hypothetical protein
MNRHIVPSLVCAAALCGATLLSGCRGAGVTPASAPPLGSLAPASGEGALRSSILVASFSGHEVLGYAPTAKGNVAPSLVIGGTKTGLGTPDNIALDASDNMYTSVDGKIVAVFAAGAHGDARPIRRISGKNTGLSFPTGVAVDSQGYLYVADCGQGNVKVFAPKAHGNVAPIRVIGVSGGCTISEAVDSNDDLYVTTSDQAGHDAISEFSPQSQGNNRVKQIEESEIKGGVGIRSIAIDSHGNIYAGNLLAKDIRVFAPSASGTSKPIRTISGSQTHLGAPTGLSLDASDKLYVTICHYCSEGSGTDSVLVFAAGVKGNVKPQAVIVGSKTKLEAPTDLVFRR